jgi:hypothetical protein
MLLGKRERDRQTDRKGRGDSEGDTPSLLFSLAAPDDVVVVIDNGSGGGCACVSIETDVASTAYRALFCQRTHRSVGHAVSRPTDCCIIKKMRAAALKVFSLV